MKTILNLMNYIETVLILPRLKSTGGNVCDCGDEPRGTSFTENMEALL
jgi:hypothetical protein